MTRNNSLSGAGWRLRSSSSMRSFTSSSKSVSIAVARSNRTGNFVPIAGYGWRRTVQAAVTRCLQPVRMPALDVA